MLHKFITDESAATAIEYGLIAMIISVAIVTAAMGVSGQLQDSFGDTADKVADALNK